MVNFFKRSLISIPPPPFFLPSRILLNKIKREKFRLPGNYTLAANPKLVTNKYAQREGFLYPRCIVLRAEETVAPRQIALARELFVGNRVKRVDCSFTFTPRFARRKLLAVRPFVFHQVVGAIASRAENYGVKLG